MIIKKRQAKLWWKLNMQSPLPKCITNCDYFIHLKCYEDKDSLVLIRCKHPEWIKYIGHGKLLLDPEISKECEKEEKKRLYNKTLDNTIKV